MTRFNRLLAVLAVIALSGCDTKPTPPASDPESIRKLEQLQSEGAHQEAGKGGKK